MNKKLKSQKGTSLIVVFIVCTAIAIIISTTFIVVGNYNLAVFSRKKELYRVVKTAPVDLDTGE